MATSEESSVRVWLVERTFSDDELNIIILTYATPEGDRYHRREIAFQALSGTDGGVAVSRDVPEHNLGTVDDEALQRRYREAVADLQDTHGPDDRV